MLSHPVFSPPNSTAFLSVHSIYEIPSNALPKHTQLSMFQYGQP